LAFILIHIFSNIQRGDVHQVSPLVTGRQSRCSDELHTSKWNVKLQLQAQHINGVELSTHRWAWGIILSGGVSGCNRRTSFHNKSTHPSTTAL